MKCYLGSAPQRPFDNFFVRFLRMFCVGLIASTITPAFGELSAENNGGILATNGRAETSTYLLKAVDGAWTLGSPPPMPTDATATLVSGQRSLSQRLDLIKVPTVSFSRMEIAHVVEALAVLAEEYDDSSAERHGVNFVLQDPKGGAPTVTLTLKNASLRQILDFVVGAIGYRYEQQADAVVIRPGGEPNALETRFFPVSRATVLRLTGRNPATSGRTTGDALAGSATMPVAAAEGDGATIRNFLQLAGVGFDSVPTSGLAFDGSQLIVTQTPRNLDRVRNILSHYQNLRQVEIEAKFMEVQQGALDELGVQWNVASQASRAGSASRSTYATGGGITRTLADAFRNATTAQKISITGPGQPVDGLSLPAIAPTIPGGVLLGAGTGPLANLTGVVGEFDVNAVVKALAQKSGTELLSAPKLTVLSGNQATITIAQELRYPQSYGQIQSQVGTGSNSGGGSAGVSITSGTPQEFTTRNIGVELKVLPTVEEDNRSSLDLNPKVTEFEGFVEYGGPSIAISGGTTVTVPPGFYQPIFAVREMNTKVTIWDGATLVMGGLTREEVKKVHDKVPVLGSIPVIGRLFRSEGESTQKRNLLIFVTATLVTPGGAPAKVDRAEASGSSDEGSRAAPDDISGG